MTKQKYWRVLDLSLTRIEIRNKSGDHPAIKAMPITQDILEQVKLILGFERIRGGYIVDTGTAAFYISKKEVEERYDIVSLYSSRHPDQER